MKITDIKPEDEWIVEQIQNDGKLKILGKIFVRPTLHLNNQQLEIIWDLCNYGPAQYNLLPIKDDCIYKNMNAIFQEEMIYIPLTDVDYCNDDIFIRKHYDNNNGYWISNNKRKEPDKWIFSNKAAFFNEKGVHINFFTEIPPRKYGDTFVSIKNETVHLDVGKIIMFDNGDTFTIVNVTKENGEINFIIRPR